MRSKKKVLIFIIILLILFIALTCCILLNQPKLTLKENLSAEVLGEVTNFSFIEKIEKGTIITKEEKIDTSSLGSKKVTLKLKNKLGIKKDYTFNVNIVDTIKPTIESPEAIETTIEEDLDLLENVTATDNFDENLQIEVIGEYDLNKVGEYNISFVAKDMSGNTTTKECTLIVKDKPFVDTNGRPLPPNRKFTTSKGFSGETKDGITYIDGVLVANKTYALPSDYGSGLTTDTLNAFDTMKNAASSEGLNIYISSGFRSFDTQEAIYNRYVRNDGKEEADTYSARPGHSEHQTGLAFDVNIIDSSFEGTKEAIWLEANCFKFGFILRYPKGKTNETGYIFEPWHFRYVGISLAEKLYNNGNWLTLEDYFGITSEYSEN